MKKDFTIYREEGNFAWTPDNPRSMEGMIFDKEFLERGDKA